ncbi:hypothetical protein B9G54_03240 [Alloscardovia macacae]|uniref:Carbon starvation protein n=1 Tax=Alloscardovia macacae TaxID=1160091 RepID=A0A1Y2T0A9_9BIFI|nr:hypothetical protein [Alloscardovia macacae]OTA26812.1 hypothetical protein B9G54_03240 [Alloscardovia macacae]OTA29164.1 hypothetical protein B9T39_04605 [Alloscardovia macacae]
MNEIAQSRLYLFTSLACIIWLGQSLYSSSQDGTLLHWSTWVFAFCIGVVAVYTGYQGWKLYVKTRPADDDEEENED